MMIWPSSTPPLSNRLAKRTWKTESLKVLATTFKQTQAWRTKLAECERKQQQQRQQRWRRRRWRWRFGWTELSRVELSVIKWQLERKVRRANSNKTPPPQLKSSSLWRDSKHPSLLQSSDWTFGRFSQVEMTIASDHYWIRGDSSELANKSAAAATEDHLLMK